MRIRLRYIAIPIGLILLLVTLVYAYCRYQYPYGWSHCCDKALYSTLVYYADKHDGEFPAGEATPEASLSLLYKEDPYIAHTLRGKSVPETVVLERLGQGQLLSPDTCGWHYVEGLTLDDDPGIALFLGQGRPRPQWRSPFRWWAYRLVHQFPPGAHSSGQMERLSCRTGQTLGQSQTALGCVTPPL
ncbi:MAG: hypothetical protein HQ582_23825 [Planctomycetes bacterium]|nr:hypothetical protein [Planctomycetota bacterium]